MLEILVRNLDGIWFGVSFRNQRIEGTMFADSESGTVKALLRGGPRDEPFEINSERSHFAEGTLIAIKNVYDGKGAIVDDSLNMERLPAYTQRVLKTVSKIPLGYVASYGGVAEAAGGGPRAVGNVMAANPFAPIIPCHRVVTSSLGLGGYGGGYGKGLRTKFELLKRERRGYSKPEIIRVEFGSMKVFPVELVVEKLDRSRKFV